MGVDTMILVILKNGGVLSNLSLDGDGEEKIVDLIDRV